MEDGDPNMVYDRYYYSVLPEGDKKIYRSLYKGIEKLEQEFTFSRSLKHKFSLGQILYFVGLDNPHIFYADFNCCNYQQSLFSEGLRVTYWYSPEDIALLKKKVQIVLGKMMSQISGKDAYEKELSVHDLLVHNIVYDNTAADHLSRYSQRANSIMGVLFYKTAICEGISKIVKLLLNLCDVKCVVAYGKADQEDIGHTWNIVKIDNIPYHLDVTWDINSSLPSFTSYSYFNLTGGEILLDHSFSIRYPACTRSTHNYFVRNGLTVSCKQDLVRVLSDARPRKQDVIMFRYTGEDQKVFEDLMQMTVRHLINGAAPGTYFSVRRVINQEQHICYFIPEGKDGWP